jgi:hypothetical protein
MASIGSRSAGYRMHSATADQLEAESRKCSAALQAELIYKLVYLENERA